MKIALYGTLKKGYPLHRLLNDSTLLSYDKVHGTLYMNGGGSIPYLVKKDKGNIRVEVYEVNDEVFSSIKNMEENAGYRTELTKLKSGDEAYVFFYQKVGNFFKKINKF